jgi:hypothetical protein
MYKFITFLLAFLMLNAVFAHDLHYEKVILKHWNISAEKKTVEGSFYMFKEGNVFIEQANHSIVNYPLTSFSKEDQTFVLEKNKKLAELNTMQPTLAVQNAPKNTSNNSFVWAVLGLMIAAAALIFSFGERKHFAYFSPIFLLGGSICLFGFTQKTMQVLQTTTSTSFLDSTFAPFKPNVNTFWDNTYFYVESKGIPTTHEMMVGISNHGWQQQVPIPQCYIGSNAWSIPLNPVMAASPIPVDSIHFTRGAIALAANGVPIFNYHTNTGVDSYLDGQLDIYGGHCGRADDYHYHIAPLHLYDYTAATLPIAFGLDGFAVYGSVEPDGTPMQTLDANHGHDFNGVYHYHGTATAPYMIANMAGQVTEDATHQLIPQAAAHPIRPSLTPLNGALITDCQPNAANNGYRLTYTLSGATDSILYSWNATGTYTFKFYTQGNGTATTQTYNGFTQCTVPTAINSAVEMENRAVIYPNPANEVLFIKLKNESLQKDVKEIMLFNAKGELVYSAERYLESIKVKNFPKGMYLLKIQFTTTQFTQKVVLQ